MSPRAKCRGLLMFHIPPLSNKSPPLIQRPRKFGKVIAQMLLLFTLLQLANLIEVDFVDFQIPSLMTDRSAIVVWYL